MKRVFTFGLSLTILLQGIKAQETDPVKIQLPDTVVQSSAAILNTNTESTRVAAPASATYPSPYKVTFKRDAPIIGAGIALTAFGTYLISQKKGLTDAELARKTRDKVPFFDRGNAGFYSEKADRDSYKPFDLSFTYPLVLLLANNNERHNAVQVLTLYLETMAVTGTIFTMSTGLVYRSRPYVYGTIASVERRKDNDSQRAFFAGHTAATAAASFYAAKAFTNFNPDSKAKPYVWAVAIATPALVGYLRYKAGMHFLSDNIIGYAVGAASGILIPKWHKSLGMKNVSIVPEVGGNSRGMAVTYRF